MRGERDAKAMPKGISMQMWKVGGVQCVFGDGRIEMREESETESMRRLHFTRGHSAQARSNVDKATRQRGAKSGREACDAQTRMLTRGCEAWHQGQRLIVSNDSTSRCGLERIKSNKQFSMREKRDESRPPKILLTVAWCGSSRGRVSRACSWRGCARQSACSRLGSSPRPSGLWCASACKRGRWWWSGCCSTL